MYCDQLLSNTTRSGFLLGTSRRACRSRPHGSALTSTSRATTTSASLSSSATRRALRSRLGHSPPPLGRRRGSGWTRSRRLACSALRRSPPPRPRSASAAALRKRRRRKPLRPTRLPRPLLRCLLLRRPLRAPLLPSPLPSRDCFARASPPARQALLPHPPPPPPPPPQARRRYRPARLHRLAELRRRHRCRLARPLSNSCSPPTRPRRSRVVGGRRSAEKQRLDRHSRRAQRLHRSGRSRARHAYRRPSRRAPVPRPTPPPLVDRRRWTLRQMAAILLRRLAETRPPTEAAPTAQMSTTTSSCARRAGPARSRASCARCGSGWSSIRCARPWAHACTSSPSASHILAPSC